MATLAIGVTVPSASRRTGIFFLTAVATSTETARGARGACATAPCGDQRLPRVDTTTPATASSAATLNTNVRFFIPFEPGHSIPPPWLPLYPLAPVHNDSFGLRTGVSTISLWAAHPVAR